MKNIAIIDLEFTGLDNSHISDNEIIQVKIWNLYNDKKIIKNFNSRKRIGAFSKLDHKVERYKNEPFFCQNEFKKMLLEIGASTKYSFYGFSIKQDRLMLEKSNIRLSKYYDIQTIFQRSKYQFRLATEGHSLECTYFIVTGKYPDNFSHSDINELDIIRELYIKSRQAKRIQLEDYMEVVPWGHCSGMDIANYVVDYRRAADGYRYNNNDEFAAALDHHIFLNEYIDEFDDDDDDF